MVLVLDWDGTCTVADSLVEATKRFGDPGVYDRTFRSYGEALAGEVATIRASEAKVSAWAVENVRLRAGLHDLVRRYRPVIVSSGLPQLIAPVLEREGFELELRCNGAEPHPDGWRLVFRDEGPCSVCGDMCKRRSLPAARPLIYVGDGANDRCASLVADRVFARDRLAVELDRSGVPYESFETMDEIAAALA